MSQPATKHDWQESTLGVIADINPRETLKKSTTAKAVAMDCLLSFTRKVAGYQTKEFGGGSKFRNGDTLLARITPCLENGKTAYVDILDADEVGFGSTEFIVIREKNNLSDKKFLYYFAISPTFREAAIRSMTGTSGRQRVQTDLIANKIFNFPSAPEQKAIGAVLSVLDDKIELLQNQNNVLEAIAQRIFHEWFIEFNFPNLEGKPYSKSGGKMTESKVGYIPSEWDSKSLFEVADYINGGAFKDSDFSSEKRGLPVIRIAELKNGFTAQTNYTEKDLAAKYYLHDEDILFSWSGSPETSIDIFIWDKGSAILNQHIFKVVPKDADLKTWVYFLLKHHKSFFIHRAKQKQTTGLGHVTVGDLKQHNIPFPSKEAVTKFNAFADPLFRKIVNNLYQIQTLSTIRDRLLPQLVRGDIRVKNF